MSQYNENSIQILEGLEAVRKRPGMYIGSTDVRGLHHLVWEIVDNAIDECLAGYGNEIEVTIEKGGYLTVKDYGRGVPTGMHATGRPTSEVIYTVLHAGGKFSSEGGYKTAGGLHGVGGSVVNALSSTFDLLINRDGKIFEQHFANGGKEIGPLNVIGKTTKTGTQVRFKPDDSIFSTTVFDFDTISERLRESAFLLKGLKISLKDEIHDQTEIFHYENGLIEFIDYLNDGRDNIGAPVYFEGMNQGIEVEVAFQFNEGYQERTFSFVNHVRTSDGGTHEVGFKSALTKSFNDYARQYNLLKEKDKNLEGNDVREGLTAVISVRIPEPILQFEGQTKGKLGTAQARSAVDAVVSEKLTYYLEENKEVSTTLVKKMIQASQARDAARKAREEARKGKKGKTEKILSGKLTPAQSKNRALNELYLVEGDSAGGSAKLGRDRKHQAILPLRGKVLNTEKAKIADILKNEEISTMIHTIGAGVGSEFVLEDSNYAKVIIMTDADMDGAHIQVLLLTFFYRYMKPLVEAGCVYIALPPLYKVSKGLGKQAEMMYAWDDVQLDQAKETIGKGYSIQRYKGLGEMNPDQLWDTTMNPESRTLIQVTIDDAIIADKRVSVLMGDHVEPRRDWIEKHVQFTLADTFIKE